MRPPGIAFIVVPVLLFLIFFVVRSPASAQVALAVPLWLILGAQCFRVVVELFLHQLWIEALIPRMLTFEGANVDIYTGLSAPLIAWLSTRGRWGLKLALVWNAPGPLNLIHAEAPNQMMGTFPFLFIPGFFVPLAVVLHVIGIRSIRDSPSKA